MRPKKRSHRPALCAAECQGRGQIEDLARVDLGNDGRVPATGFLDHTNVMTAHMMLCLAVLEGRRDQHLDDFLSAAAHVLSEDRS
ncbi:hypothetical protein OG819_22590 [Streptomyces sp. NBC_01549]|uniref:hypothetical protein n=1 Tax=Streptomyces sp. NBC_01549 TaxID=2975874 RepID=UPI0022538E44|nr:hypothetical protein [Streptomyces sp. NBC_01549]MCX4592420.1 hypothetical protein [Streptomyces sp. NBC_01549]